MGRPKRADAAGHCYHMLKSRGNHAPLWAIHRARGHLYQGRYKSFPVQSDEQWVESVAKKFDLESTMRPRGRPKEFRPAEMNS